MRGRLQSEAERIGYWIFQFWKESLQLKVFPRNEQENNNDAAAAAADDDDDDDDDDV